MKKRTPTSSPRLLDAARSADEDLVECCFAIFPDDTTAGSRPRPIAIFDTLEDAMEWGLQRFKGGAFRLRYERFLLLTEPRAQPLQKPV
jgi:hypothetical protein